MPIAVRRAGSNWSTAQRHLAKADPVMKRIIQKRAYLHNLASHFCNDAALIRRFARMDDEAVIQSLIHIKGIGRWTVEMFLIFCLNRPDVWPVDDFGVRKAIQIAYGLKELPTKKEMMQLGEKWRP